jgi:hypothetical protein
MMATGRETASPAPPSRRRNFGQYGVLFSWPFASRILPDQAWAPIGVHASQGHPSPAVKLGESPPFQQHN